MHTFSFKEDHISQIPALQLLIKLGYTYLSQAEAEKQRGGKTTQVLLEDILRKQLKEINSIRVSAAKTSIFTDENIEKGILALKSLPMNEGYIAACEKAYQLLTLGHALEQSIDGDKKSFTMQYIDWKNRSNNVFHVTEEFSVMRSKSREHYRPDLVLFVNGIPICIIECKRPDLKDAIAQAISQTLRNQQPDGIRNLYAYSQLLLCVSGNEGIYGSNDTKPEFFSRWIEKFDSKEAEARYRQTLHDLKNQALTPAQKDQLFASRFRYVRDFFDSQEQGEVLPTVQDEYIFNLCRPERLMDLTFNFILFENHVKKITRYQQYFTIKKTIARIRTPENGRRRGGVIWHTQGSGKSLTMVMLAQAIAMEPAIRNPKIVLVTDRTDLDRQITETFKKCGKSVQNAPTGQRLAELLENKSDAVVTTIINKFQAAVKKVRKLDSPDIFVLVDEGHRTQHGIFNVEMQKSLPNACFIALTGTPLFKRDKSTATKFGGIIDAYTVDQAVADKAVVPLLYEGRLAIQKVNEKPIDTFFDRVSEPLTDYQKADLKRKFSRADQLNSAEQKVYAIAWDISIHFRDNWQGTPFKAQLVCDKKSSAIRYKEFLDEIGLVTSEVLISPIDEREGEESAFEHSVEKVKRFWSKMMEEHHKPKNYEQHIISRFKNQKDPEIIIVVDKLLTGFDEPKNTVLYLTRSLQGHKLLQAIARVNRVCSGKEFGYIIDYYGVLGNLDEALKVYASLEEFDKEDVDGTLTDISEETKKLPQKHAEVWDIFKTIPNKQDVEAYQRLLKDEEIRLDFYDKLGSFARSLKLALSSVKFHESTDEKTIERYKNDLTDFMKLRRAVIERYSDAVDFRQYESQIQKLIDTHITTDTIQTITELVNIFDKEKFQQEVENTLGTAAKADKIASRTAKHISEKMEEDPAFYKKFSQMLNDTISDYEAKRISEVQFLTQVQEIMNQVLARTDNHLPEELNSKEVAKAFFGLAWEAMESKTTDNRLRRTIATATALQIDALIHTYAFDNQRPIIDWQYKTSITGRLVIEIGDYLIDEVRDKYSLDISFEEMDSLANQCLEVAKIRYKS
jgi:type I restriction enzyme R subunit